MPGFYVNQQPLVIREGLRQKKTAGLARRSLKRGDHTADMIISLRSRHRRRAPGISGRLRLVVIGGRMNDHATADDVCRTTSDREAGQVAVRLALPVASAVSCGMSPAW